jgi:hypothetical protein
VESRDGGQARAQQRGGSAWRQACFAWLYENDAGAAAELDPRRSSAPPGDEVCADAPWIRRTMAALINRFDLLELDWDTARQGGAHCSGWEAGGPRTERVVRQDELAGAQPLRWLPLWSAPPSLSILHSCPSSSTSRIYLSRRQIPRAGACAHLLRQEAPLLDAISFRHLHIPTSSRARKGEVTLGVS